MSESIILFDGVCGLCNAWVDFVLRIDRQGRYQFTPLQSQKGQAILQQHGFRLDYTDSVLLIQGGRPFSHSDAVLHTLRGVGGIWRVAYAARMIPRPVRDAIYRLVASNRYRLFGRKQTCRIPAPAERMRFI
jgi:predicted DCC family thiol-disulfide oxidoreductase YuxK